MIRELAEDDDLVGAFGILTLVGNVILDLLESVVRASLHLAGVRVQFFADDQRSTPGTVHVMAKNLDQSVHLGRRHLLPLGFRSRKFVALENVATDERRV